MHEGRGMDRDDPGTQPRIAVQCVRETPIWKGTLIQIWDRNFTLGTDPETGGDVTVARLWAQVLPGAAILLAKGRSLEGPVDALLAALRKILGIGTWTLPSIATEGTPDVGLLDPGRGTQSGAFVRAQLRIDTAEHIDVATEYRDLDTALFLAYATAYDRSLVVQYDAQLQHAHMTTSDALALMRGAPAPGA